MLKPLFVRELTDDEHDFVKRMAEPYRTIELRSPCDKRLRKAIAIFFSHEGNTSSQIATMMHAHPTTIQRWIRAFNKIGVEFFKFATKPGRPCKVDQEFRHYTWEALDKSPTQFGYNATKWTMLLLRKHLYRVTGQAVSLRTLYKVKNDLSLVCEDATAISEENKEFGEYRSC